MSLMVRMLEKELERAELIEMKAIVEVLRIRYELLKLKGNMEEAQNIFDQRQLLLNHIDTINLPVEALELAGSF